VGADKRIERAREGKQGREEAEQRAVREESRGE